MLAQSALVSQKSPTTGNSEQKGAIAQETQVFNLTRRSSMSEIISMTSPPHNVTTHTKWITQKKYTTTGYS